MRPRSPTQAPTDTHQQPGEVPQEGDVGHHELAGAQKEPGVEAGGDGECTEKPVCRRPHGAGSGLTRPFALQGS